MKHYVIQKNDHSWYACGSYEEIQTGRNNAFDWNDVTCQDCLSLRPKNTARLPALESPVDCLVASPTACTKAILVVGDANCDENIARLVKRLKDTNISITVCFDKFSAAMEKAQPSIETFINQLKELKTMSLTKPPDKPYHQFIPKPLGRQKRFKK